MNIYHLITRSEESYWVRASTSGRAIAYVESISGERVSCWFIGGTPRPRILILDANQP